MAAARRTTPRAATRRRRGVSRRWVIAPARRASPPTRSSCAVAAAGRSEGEPADGTLDQEGTVRRGAPHGADPTDERGRQQADDQDLVAEVDDLPGDGGP